MNLLVQQEITQLFFNELPLHHADLLKAHENNDLDSIRQIAHKLHGACCYCEVPELKQAVIALETAVKTNKYKPAELAQVLRVIESTLRAHHD